MNWRRHLRAGLLAGLCLAAPACKQAREAREDGGLTPGAAVLKEETHKDVCGPLINYLADGGRVYVGAVESVTVVRREGAGPSAWHESGKFTVQVKRAVRGPAVKELRLGYSFLDLSAPGATLFGDWGGDAWRERPQVGEQVLLVLSLDPDFQRTSKHWADQNWERGAQVGHVWVGVGADHPLVKDIELAVRYLDQPAPGHRLAHYKRLCRSAWPSVRCFAQGAAFGSHYGWSQYPKFKEGQADWSSECRLMVEYLKTAGPLLTDWERVDVSRTVRFALCSVYSVPPQRYPFAAWVSRHAKDAAAEWLAAFEDWFLTELGADALRLKPERSRQALIELQGLICCFGVDGTLAFFRKRGRAGLEERLKACAKSSDDLLAASAKQWLDIVRSGRKIAVGTLANSEGDWVSLQAVLADDVYLDAPTTYGAENLPPGVRIHPSTGVLSGRIQVGAAANGPYKVRIWCVSRTRRLSDHQEVFDHKQVAEFTWQVRPRVHLVD